MTGDNMPLVFLLFYRYLRRYGVGDSLATDVACIDASGCLDAPDWLPAGSTENLQTFCGPDMPIKSDFMRGGS